MKLLEIDYNYYALPAGMTGVDDFIEYANKHYHSFIQLMEYTADACEFPYLVEEDTQTAYVNIANCNCIREVEATIYSRKEYDARLEQVIQQKCLDCVNYEEGEDLSEHRKWLCLDGSCVRYEKTEE